MIGELAADADFLERPRLERDDRVIACVVIAIDRLGEIDTTRARRVKLRTVDDDGGAIDRLGLRAVAAAIVRGVGQVADIVDVRAVGGEAVAVRKVGPHIEQIFGIAPADRLAPACRRRHARAARTFPFADEVEVVGGQLGLADQQVELRALAVRRGRTEARIGDDAVRDRRRLENVAAPSTGNDVHRLAAIVVVAVDVQAVERQRDVVGRLGLDRADIADALTLLREIRVVDAERRHRIGEILARAAGDRRIRVLQDRLTARIADEAPVGIGLEKPATGILEPEEFNAGAGQVLLVVGDGAEHAERAAFVVPAVQARRADVTLVCTVVVRIAARREDRVGRRVERTARADDDRAADAAFLDARLGRLVDFEALDEFGREQRIVEGTAGRIVVVAAPVGRGDRVTIEQHAVERRVGAVDRDLLALAEATIDADAGNVREGFGDVAVGELADRLSTDDVDDRVGLTLNRNRTPQTPANSGDDDVFTGFVGDGSGRRCSLRCCGGIGRWRSDGVCRRRGDLRERAWRYGDEDDCARSQQNLLTENHCQSPFPLAPQRHPDARRAPLITRRLVLFWLLCERLGRTTV